MNLSTNLKKPISITLDILLKNCNIYKKILFCFLKLFLINEYTKMYSKYMINIKKYIFILKNCSKC